MTDKTLNWAEIAVLGIVCCGCEHVNQDGCNYEKDCGTPLPCPMGTQCLFNPHRPDKQEKAPRSEAEGQKYKDKNYERTEKKMPAKIEIDEERALQLFRDGGSDFTVAQALGVSHNTIAKWRRAKGIEPRGRIPRGVEKQCPAKVAATAQEPLTTDEPELVPQLADGPADPSLNSLEASDSSEEILPEETDYYDEENHSTYYAYAGDMSPEAYEAMQKAADADQERYFKISERLWDIGQIPVMEMSVALESEQAKLRREANSIARNLEDVGIYVRNIVHQTQEPKVDADKLEGIAAAAAAVAAEAISRAIETVPNVPLSQLEQMINRLQQLNRDYPGANICIDGLPVKSLTVFAEYDLAGNNLTTQVNLLSE